MYINLGTYEIGINCSFEEGVRLSKKYGFQGLDLEINECKKIAAENGISYIKNLLCNNKLQPGGWFYEYGFNENETVFQSILKDVPSLAKLAEAIGSTRALSWLVPYSDDLEPAQNFKQHVSRIRLVAKILADHGQKLGLEYVGPFSFREGHKYPFIFDLRGIIALIQEIGCPNVGIIMDSFHWYNSHGTIEDIIKLDKNLAIFVHLSDIVPNIPLEQQLDSNRRMPRSGGVVDNVGFLKALQQIGYDGPVDAEPLASEETHALSNDEVAQLAFENLTDLFRAADIK